MSNLITQLETTLAHYQAQEVTSPLPEAAVLLAVTDSATNPELIFTRRASHLSSHAGQVAFPGGKKDPTDQNLYQTALRESREEIGLAEQLVQPLGKLSDVISLHGFKVRPYVGLIPENVKFTPSPDELDAVFSVPLGWLLDDPRSHTDVIPLADNQSLYVPCYKYQGFAIWGLSAMMLVEFLQVGFKMPINLNTPPKGKVNLRPLRPLPIK